MNNMPKAVMSIEKPPESKPKTEKDEDQEVKQEKEIKEAGMGAKFLSSAKEYMWKLIPATLEGTHKANRAINAGLEYVQTAFNNVVPAASELVTGILLPAHVARIIDKTVEYGTKGTTFTAKILSKAALNFFTLGSLTWADAIRQHLAVKDAEAGLEGGKTVKDITALSYIEHIKDKDIQKALKKYFKLREELAKAREAKKIDQEKITRLSIDIVNFEVNYADNVDFSNLKAILEKGKDFIVENTALVDKLSSETAERMIKRVEEYYKDQLGDVLGGEVEVTGTWLSMFKSPEKRRELLKETIEKRLNKVFRQELNDKQTMKEMEGVHLELISSFGVYRKYLHAAIYSILRLAPVPVYTEGEEGSFINEIHRGINRGVEEGVGDLMIGTPEWGVGYNQIAEAVDVYIESAGGISAEIAHQEVVGEVLESLQLEDADVETLAEVSDVVKHHMENLSSSALESDGMTFYPTVGEYVDAVGNSVKMAAGKVAEVGSREVTELYLEIKSQIAFGAKMIKSFAVEKFDAAVEALKNEIRTAVKEAIVTPATETIESVSEALEEAVEDVAEQTGTREVLEAAGVPEQAQPIITRASRMIAPLPSMAFDFFYSLVRGKK